MLILPNDIPQGISSPEDFNIATTCVPHDRFIKGLDLSPVTALLFPTDPSNKPLQSIESCIESVRQLAPDLPFVQGQDQDPFALAMCNRSSLMLIVDCAKYSLDPVTTFVFAILWAVQKSHLGTTISRVYGVMFSPSLSASQNDCPMLLQTANLSEQFLHSVSQGIKPLIETQVIQLDPSTPKNLVNDAILAIPLSLV